VTVDADQLVSVIIPTHDRPESLGRAVRSVLDQTYEALEVVVVDDASTEPVVLSADLAGDPRVRVYRLDEQSGPGQARNEGVRASTGSLIAFLDDDDIWRPTKIERQLDVLARHGESVDAVETGYDLRDGERLVLRYLPDPDRDLRTALLAKPYLQPSTVLLRRAAFDHLGGFDAELTRIEDWDLWVRFSDSHEVSVLPEVLVDRQVSHTDPAVVLRWYREMVRRLEPRIDALPPADRSRTRSTHLLVESELLAELCDGRAARRYALRALRERPQDWRRPALALVRSVIGERIWAGTKRLFYARARPLVRMFGRDPLVRR
jgi:glycosyltransferase involved in cell wall biosynthesis